MAEEIRVKKYQTRKNKNNRVGVLWSQDEEKQLKSEIQSDMSITDIATAHKRSENAIKLRLVRIAAGEVGHDLSVEQAAKKWCVDVENVQKEVDRKTKAKGRKPAESSSSSMNWADEDAEIPDDKGKKKEKVSKKITLAQRVTQLELVVANLQAEMDQLKVAFA